MLACVLPGAELHFIKHSQLLKDLRLALSMAKATEEKAQKPSSPLILCLLILLLSILSREPAGFTVRPRAAWENGKPVPVPEFPETSLLQRPGPPGCHLTLVFLRPMSLLAASLWPVNGSHRRLVGAIEINVSINSLVAVVTAFAQHLTPRSSTVLLWLRDSEMPKQALLSTQEEPK